MRNFLPTSIRLSGDRVAAQAHIKYARTLLGQLRNQVDLGEVWQGSRRITLPDGGFIHVSTIQGLPPGANPILQVHIHVPEHEEREEEDEPAVLGIVVNYPLNITPLNGDGRILIDQNKTIYVFDAQEREEQIPGASLTYKPVFPDGIEVGNIDWQSGNGEIIISWKGPHNRTFLEYDGASGDVILDNKIYRRGKVWLSGFQRICGAGVEVTEQEQDGGHVAFLNYVTLVTTGDPQLPTTVTLRFWTIEYIERGNSEIEQLDIGDAQILHTQSLTAGLADEAKLMLNTTMFFNPTGTEAVGVAVNIQDTGSGIFIGVPRSINTFAEIYASRLGGIVVEQKVAFRRIYLGAQASYGVNESNDPISETVNGLQEPSITGVPVSQPAISGGFPFTETIVHAMDYTAEGVLLKLTEHLNISASYFVEHNYVNLSSSMEASGSINSLNINEDSFIGAKYTFDTNGSVFPLNTGRELFNDSTLLNKIYYLDLRRDIVVYSVATTSSSFNSSGGDFPVIEYKHTSGDAADRPLYNKLFESDFGVSVLYMKVGSETAELHIYEDEGETLSSGFINFAFPELQVNAEETSGPSGEWFLLYAFKLNDKVDANKCEAVVWDKYSIRCLAVQLGLRLGNLNEPFSTYLLDDANLEEKLQIELGPFPDNFTDLVSLI